MDIKFRGISEESGRYVYGCLIQSKPNKVDGDCVSWIKPRDSLMLGVISTPTDTFTEVKTSTVGQFTGLKDKNGRDIYEGESVKVFGDESEITYSESNTCFNFQNVDSPFTIERLGKYSAPAFEIVNSTHQHPELMESN